jgi:8-oxo-dGTP pyrophosphatase MutT (NUDIX family)
MKKILDNWHNYLKEGKQVDSDNVAKAVIFDEDLNVLLLATDNNPQFEGQWDLPGGHVMVNENIIDGLIREVWEETGLIVINPEELYKKGTTTFFIAELPKGNIKLSGEHKDHKFVSLDNLDDYKISDKFRDAIKRAHE